MSSGWRSREERELVNWAVGRGWRVGVRNGMGHIMLVWPETGAKVPVASHPQGRAATNAKAQLRRTETLGTSRP
jgi:hypothetical protein